MHEPLRLQVFIEAPQAAMDAILARHEGVRQLVDHEWLHLHALAEDGTLRLRHAAGDWRAA